MSLAEQIAVNKFGFYPQPYEKEWKAFQSYVQSVRKERIDNNTYTFDMCKGKRQIKKRVRIPQSVQFLSQFK